MFSQIFCFSTLTLFIFGKKLEFGVYIIYENICFFILYVFIRKLNFSDKLKHMIFVNIVFKMFLIEKHMFFKNIWLHIKFIESTWTHNLIKMEHLSSITVSAFRHVKPYNKLFRITNSILLISIDIMVIDITISDRFPSIWTFVTYCKLGFL